MKSTIIYITGQPGMGKYTIAKELEKRGFVVCDNQLINNPIFALLQYDGLSDVSQTAWDYIKRIRDVIFDFIRHEKSKSYVLTNNLYEYEGDRVLFEEVRQMAEARGSLFVPVRLLISQQEHLKRIVSPARLERLKSIDPQDVFNQATLLKINHPNLFEPEVTNLSPAQVAEAILDHIKKL